MQTDNPIEASPNADGGQQCVYSHLRGVRVLVVDDTRSIRHMMVRTLQGQDMLVMESENGVEALARLKKAAECDVPFDLLLTDLHMPELDGYGLLKKIRTIDSIRTTPVIVASTENQKAAIVEACQFGVSSYLLKPFTTQKLIETVHKALAGSHKASDKPEQRGLTGKEVEELSNLLFEAARQEVKAGHTDDSNPVHHPVFKAFQDYLNGKQAG